MNQNLNTAFVLFEMRAANEISILDPCERTLGKCCTDPLKPPDFTGTGNLAKMRLVGLRLCSGLGESCGCYIIGTNGDN